MGAKTSLGKGEKGAKKDAPNPQAFYMLFGNPTSINGKKVKAAKKEQRQQSLLHLF